MRLAEIHPLPGREWNAHAALGDAMQRATQNAKLMVVWFGEDGQLRCAQSGMVNHEILWVAEMLRLDCTGARQIFSK